jgi:site-specific recombinase XerD
MVLTLQQASASFARALRADGKSPRTIATYLAAVTRLGDYLDRHGLSRELGSILPDAVRGFLNELEDQGAKEATRNTRCRGLKRYFAWATAEGELDEDPTARIHTPKLTRRDVSFPTDEEIRRLLATCEGQKAFVARRDAAVIRLFLDTGIRREELAGLRTDEVDLDRGLVLIHGKGGDERTLALGSKTIRALDRYVNARTAHPDASSPRLWLGGGGSGKRGVLTGSGIYRLIARRAEQAGIGHLHPHQLRHKSAHEYMESPDISESEILYTFGWKRRDMLEVYASVSRGERARAAARRASIGDKF